MAPGSIQADGRPCRAAHDTVRVRRRGAQRVVSRRRHRGRECRAVACSSHLEMREDLSNDGSSMVAISSIRPAQLTRPARAGSYGQKPPDANHWSGQALEHGAS